LIIFSKRRNTLLNGFGRRNLSQLLKYHAFSAETEKGTITELAACAKRITPGLTIPEGPLGPSTIWAASFFFLKLAIIFFKAFLPPFEEEPQKKNNTTLIIVIIVLLVLCCCCVVFGGALSWLWFNGDQFLEEIMLLPQFVL